MHRAPANPSGGVMAKRRKANGAGGASVPPAPSSLERETLDVLVASLKTKARFRSNTPTRSRSPPRPPSVKAMIRVTTLTSPYSHIAVRGSLAPADRPGAEADHANAAADSSEDSRPRYGFTHCPLGLGRLDRRLDEGEAFDAVFDR